MSRMGGLILGLGLFAVALPSQASAFGQGSEVMRTDARQQSLIVQVKPLTERQKCHALNRCRQKYTRCYNKLVAQHKSIDKHKIECVKPYQKCINASFSGFEFFFTRWFNPNHIDCKQYSG